MQVPRVMAGTIALALLRALILRSVGQLSGFLVQQVVQRLFDALLDQIFQFGFDYLLI